MQLKTILGFPNFYNVVKDQKMPIKTAYKLSRLAKSIETEIQFYQEKLREITCDDFKEEFCDRCIEEFDVIEI